MCTNLRSAIFVMLSGCGAVMEPAPAVPPDAPPPHDEPPHAAELTGVVSERTTTGDAPVRSATVEFFADNVQPIVKIGAAAKTATNGRFSIARDGAPDPLDGYFQIDAVGFLRGYAHLVLPLHGTPPDQAMPIFTAEGVRALATAAGTTQQADAALVVVTVIDPDGTPVDGVSVVANVPVCYERNHAPTCAATVTDYTGRAWMFSVPETGDFTISATRGGNTYATSFPTEANTTIVTGVRR
jgi:hypothetical protein